MAGDHMTCRIRMEGAYDQRQIEARWVCRNCVERYAARLRDQAEASTFMQDVIRRVNWTKRVEIARVLVLLGW